MTVFLLQLSNPRNAVVFLKNMCSEKDCFEKAVGIIIFSIDSGFLYNPSQNMSMFGGIIKSLH